MEEIPGDPRQMSVQSLEALPGCWNARQGGGPGPRSETQLPSRARPRRDPFVACAHRIPAGFVTARLLLSWQAHKVAGGWERNGNKRQWGWNMGSLRSSNETDGRMTPQGTLQKHSFGKFIVLRNTDSWNQEEKGDPVHTKDILNPFETIYTKPSLGSPRAKKAQPKHFCRPMRNRTMQNNK